MKIDYLEKPKEGWCFKITPSKQHPRHWIVSEDIEVTLSDSSVIVIPKGFIWDGASIPKWAWVLFDWIDFIAIWYLIHDFLWKNKEEQLKRFRYHIFDTRKFADDEILKWVINEPWRVRAVNVSFHFIIRKIGGFYYSRQFKIPD